MKRSLTVVVGSQQWCDDWAEFFWNRACRWADRAMKYPLAEERFIVLAMSDMFQSYYWEDQLPWACTEEKHG